MDSLNRNEANRKSSGVENSLDIIAKSGELVKVKPADAAFQWQCGNLISEYRVGDVGRSPWKARIERTCLQLKILESSSISIDPDRKCRTGLVS